MHTAFNVLIDSAPNSILSVSFLANNRKFQTNCVFNRRFVFCVKNVFIKHFTIGSAK